MHVLYAGTPPIDTERVAEPELSAEEMLNRVVFV